MKEKKEQKLDHDEEITLYDISFNQIEQYLQSGRITGSHGHVAYLKYLLKYNLLG
jgi:hypothetical protein